MSAVEVVDYSWARPNPRALTDAGYTGVIRYASYEPDHAPAKDLGRVERDVLWGHGLSLGLVWETTARAPLDGYDTGARHGERANVRADRLGWPDGVAVAYAVDFAPAAAEMPAVLAYLRGVKAAGGRPVGVYGSYKVIEHIARHEPVHCYWQCAAWSGRGRGTGGAIHVPAYGHEVPVSRHACLFQFYGSVRVADTDHNVALATRDAGRVADLLYHPDQLAGGQEDDDMREFTVKFPSPDFPHPHAQYPAIMLRFCAYPTATGVRDGWHFRAMDDIEVMVGGRAGKVDVNRSEVLAAGDHDLDNLYGNLPHVLPGASYAVERGDPGHEPLPGTPQLTDEQIAQALARVLARTS